MTTNDLTPAAELRAAAAKLFAAATAAQEDVASNDYWSCYEPATAWRDGLVGGFGGKSGDLAGMCTPAFVIAVARWLDREAQIWTALETAEAQLSPEGLKLSWPISTHPEALAVARSINTPTEEPTP